MSRTYTTAKLITSAGVRIGIPVIQELYRASEQLLICDEVMQDTIIPMVMKRRKAHFLDVYDQTTTTTTAYELHTEAMDHGLFNVTYVNAAGREYPLDPIDFDQEVENRPRPDDSAATTGDPSGYYVRGDRLYLYPSVTAGKTLRQHFYRRPNRLCRSAAYTYSDGTTEAAEAVQVVSVNTTTGAITCTTGAVPTTITTSTPVCVVKGTPGFRLRFETLTPTVVTTSVVTLGGASQIATVAAAGIVAGDWLCLAGDSPVLQLPVEAHGHLAQRLGEKMLEGLEDEIGLAFAKRDREEIEKRYVNQFPLRVEQAPKEVTSDHKLSDGVLGY